MTDRFMTMLALERADFADGREVVAALKSFAPNVPAEALGEQQSEASTPTNLVKIGQTVFAVMYINKPLPPDATERPLAYNQNWPEAKAAFQQHRAHVVAAVFQGGEGFAAARQSAVDLTLLTAALIQSHPVLGVLWTAGNTVAKPEGVFDALKKISEQSFPLDFWLQITPYRPPSIPQGEQVLGFVTEGLQPFVGREIQFEPASLPPQELASRVLNIAHYLLAQGPVLQDGETLGMSETEKVRIHHKAEGARPGVPILELVLEQADTPAAPPPRPGAGRATFGKRGRT